jgi:hypothetical protein
MEDSARVVFRALLDGHTRNLDEVSMHWISNHIDCFVSQSRGNEDVEVLVLYPYEYAGQDDIFWDKVGQAVGNLKALNCLRLSSFPNHHGDGLPIPDGEILARILSHMRQKVRVDHDDSDTWGVEAVQALARGICGHPTITSFDSCFNFPFESMGSLYGALATLPALESVTISSSGRTSRLEDECNMAHHESLTELLRAPCLRSFCFGEFSFTPALCQATSNALMEGTAVTKLEFIKCTFSSVECAAIITKGLSTNTSVRSITVQCENARAIFVALAAALVSNSTLRHLDLSQSDDDERDCLSPAFSALGQNVGLKTLIIGVSVYAMDEALCTAMQNGLEMNETLESLELNNVHLCDDTAALWCRVFSFLRTNKTLKSLKINTHDGQTEPHVAAFRIDVAAMLQENTSLESLAIQSWIRRDKTKFEEYFVVVTALQRNTTLKTFSIYQWHSDMAGCLQLNDDEDKRMASLLKKNYALESLSDIDLENEARDTGAILRLNKAGRRYLIEDGSSISKGVEVFSGVNNDTNCVFLHLLENPRLCDRSAVERATAGESNVSSSTNPTDSSGGGKREQASTHKGNESRRRLT